VFHVWIENYMARVAVGSSLADEGQHECGSSQQVSGAPVITTPSRVLADDPPQKYPVCVLRSTAWNDHVQAVICARRLSCDHTC
jgi:hypothetical protein